MCLLIGIVSVVSNVTHEPFFHMKGYVAHEPFFIVRATSLFKGR